MLREKVALKIFSVFTGKHKCGCLYLIKSQGSSQPLHYKKDSNTGAFLNFNNTFSTAQLQATARRKYVQGGRKKLPILFFIPKLYFTIFFPYFSGGVHSRPGRFF